MEKCGNCQRKLPPLGTPTHELTEWECYENHVCVGCRQRYCPGELIDAGRWCNVHVGFTHDVCSRCNPEWKRLSNNYIRDLRAKYRDNIQAERRNGQANYRK